MDRRSFFPLFGSLLSVCFGGCLGGASIADLYLSNKTHEQVVTTTTVIRDSTNEEIFSNTITIDSYDSTEYENPIQENGLHEIHVSVEDGPENSYKWDAPASDTSGIAIDIHYDNIEFSEVVV